MKTSIRPYVFVAYALVFVLILNGCSSSTSPNGDAEQEPIGMRVYTAPSFGVPGELVVEQLPTGVTGEFTITDTPSNYTVVFLDEELNEFIPDLAEHSISVNATENAGHISINRPNITTQNVDFSLTGIQGNTAKIVITLTHEGSSEFVSRAFNVSININEAP